MKGQAALVAASAAVLVAALAGAVLDAPSASAAAPAWHRVLDREAGISLEVPAAWRVRRQPGVRLIREDPRSELVSTAVSLVLYQAKPGTIFGEVAAQFGADPGEQKLCIGERAKATASTIRLPAGPALAIVSTCPVAVEGRRVSTISRGYVLLHDERVYVVYFQANAALASKVLPIFGRSARSIRFGRVTG